VPAWRGSVAVLPQAKAWAVQVPHLLAHRALMGSEYTMRLRTVGATPQSLRGITLIELMVAISVLAILLAIAIPSFENALLGSKLSSQANTFLASLQLARSEAIKRNGRVIVCKSANGAVCTSAGGWEQGWIIHPDGAPGEIIYWNTPLQNGFLLRGETGVENSVAFERSGAAVVGGTFTLCRALPTIGTQVRQISVSSTGHGRIARETSNQCP
jgi:type IV fimbrial biogenesis protein FimT